MAGQQTNGAAQTTHIQRRAQVLTISTAMLAAHVQRVGLGNVTQDALNQALNIANNLITVISEGK